MHRLHILFLAVFLVLSHKGTVFGQVTGEDVEQAIARGVGYLKKKQAPDGSWSYKGRGWSGGMTALAVLALSSSGVPDDDPKLQGGIKFFIGEPLQKTYIVALNALALAQVDRERYLRRIEACADWLARAQNEAGFWTYTNSQGRGQVGDNSNTQYAILGLGAAECAGIVTPRNVWRKAERHYAQTQNEDGGWGYRARDASYGSMTAAGLASLYIMGHRLHRPVAGVSPTCVGYREDVRIAAAIQWLAKNFSVTSNPRKGGKWHYYYLYALERAGMLSGERYFGGHDWYREGAEYLVKAQKADGSWGNEVDTAFALLFLAKARPPVLMQKLRWRGSWNDYPEDVKNLVAYVSEKFGKEVSWQQADLRAPLEDLLQAPILFLNGHTTLGLTAPEAEKLKKFVEEGGYIFATCNCTQPAFPASFRRLMQKLFPQRRLGPLDPQHPLYGAYFRLGREAHFLEGVNFGCRTAVIFSPRDLAKFYQTGSLSDNLANKIAANVVAYATGLEVLRDKLERIELIKMEEMKEVPRGALVFCQLRHEADWDPAPLMALKLLDALRKNAGVAIFTARRDISPSSKEIFNYPLLYMTGRYEFQFSQEEIENLKEYFRRGGVLFADACCGKEKFDTAFRKMVSQIFPENSLEPLSPDHAIFSAFYKTRKVKYTTAVLREKPGLELPYLEAVIVKGHPAIIYSKYDLVCAIAGHTSLDCKGLRPESALPLAINMVIYAMTD